MLSAFGVDFYVLFRAFGGCVLRAVKTGLRSNRFGCFGPQTLLTDPTTPSIFVRTKI